jgi:hypothetical protein
LVDESDDIGETGRGTGEELASNWQKGMRDIHALEGATSLTDIVPLHPAAMLHPAPATLQVCRPVVSPGIATDASINAELVLEHLPNTPAAQWSSFCIALAPVSAPLARDLLSKIGRLSG